jgi:small-conductance mechanosensitive channel
MDLSTGLQDAAAQFGELIAALTASANRSLLAVLVLLAGALAAFALGRALKFLARRMAGAGRRGETDEAPVDTLIIEILAGAVSLLILLSSAAAAANIAGLWRLENAEDAVIAAAKGASVLLAVWFLAGWISNRVRRFGSKLAERSHTGEQTLFVFLSSLIRIAGLAVGLIAALQQFGFPMASLVAVVGAAGLAIALALQDTLKAVAAGVIIAVFRPYRIGDFVRIAGEEGTVVDITPFTTHLTTLDNREVVITNDRSWGDTIVNYSVRGTRRLEMTFSVSYDDDLDKALDVLRTVAASDSRVMRDQPIWAKVTALSQSSVDLKLRAWCRGEDYVDLRGDLLKAVKEAFDRAGLTIPYPHQVHVEAAALRRPRGE